MCFDAKAIERAILRHANDVLDEDEENSETVYQAGGYQEES